MQACYFISIISVLMKHRKEVNAYFPLCLTTAPLRRVPEHEDKRPRILDRNRWRWAVSFKLWVHSVWLEAPDSWSRRDS